MIRILFFVLLLPVLNQCTRNSNLEPIDEYVLLNDRSSKVWLINRLLDGEKDYTPLQFEYREVIVFHETRNAFFYTLNKMGQSPGKKMIYWMDTAEKTFGFRNEKHEYLFSIQYISRKKIILVPKLKTYKYTIELIPFPEF